jgi:hypothetical protein
MNMLIPTPPRPAGFASDYMRHASSKLSSVAFMALMITCGYHLIYYFVYIPTENTELRFFLWIMRAFLMTPYLIAVHRFTICDEGYRFAPTQPRFLYFFGGSVIIQMLASVLTPALPIAAAFATAFSGIQEIILPLTQVGLGPSVILHEATVIGSILINSATEMMIYTLIVVIASSIYECVWYRANHRI